MRYKIDKLKLGLLEKMKTMVKERQISMAVLQ